MRRANGRVTVSVVVRRSIDVDMRMEGMPDSIVPMTDPVMAGVVADMSTVMHASMSDSVTNAMTDSVADAVSNAMTAMSKAVPSVTKAVATVTNAVAAVSEAMPSAVTTMLGLHAPESGNRQHERRNDRKRTSAQ